MQQQFENVDQLKLALEAAWDRLSQTFLLTRASMNGDNVLKLLSRTIEDALNWTSFQIIWTILLYINLPLDLLLYDIVGFRIFMFYKVV